MGGIESKEVGGSVASTRRTSRLIELVAGGCIAVISMCIGQKSDNLGRYVEGIHSNLAKVFASDQEITEIPSSPPLKLSEVVSYVDPVKPGQTNNSFPPKDGIPTKPEQFSDEISDSLPFVSP